MKLTKKIQMIGWNIYINGKDQNTIIIKFGLSAETTAKEKGFCGKQIVELEDTTFDFRLNSARNLLYDFD